MIIARGTTSEGKELLILGLSEENVIQLMGDKLMDLTPESHPGIPEGWNVVIIFGKTEMDLYHKFKAAGVIGEDTQVIPDPRL